MIALEPRRIFLGPGEWRVAGQGMALQTILGSCVSVTFWHAAERIGGMCHYLLPGRPHAGRDAGNGLYCDEALALLQKEIGELGLPLRAFRCEIHGGAAMFPRLHAGDATHIGDKNVEAARAGLRLLGLTAVREHVGGNRHRRIVLHTDTGRVAVDCSEALDVAACLAPPPRQAQGKPAPALPLRLRERKRP